MSPHTHCAHAPKRCGGLRARPICSHGRPSLSVLARLEYAALDLALNACRFVRHGAIATRKRQQILADIRRFLDKHLGSADSAAADKHTIEIATAALLVETVRMDGDVKPIERDAVLRAVRGKFHLTNDEAQTLIDLAEKEAREASDYYQFTSIINKRFSQQQKIRVVELLWEVAYADKSVDPYEEHLIRKLADLLYVEHRDYITAKLRARDASS